MDFVAIDFETASGSADSACQLAAVIVKDSQIVDEHSWLIKPPRMFFSRRNIAVHGIRPKQVANAPNMEQLWSILAPLLDAQVILAHNARFDISVLVHSLATFDIACPDLEFSCTRLLARYAWPGRSRYGLKPLGDWLGIDFQHHDALEDARCCARIALAISKACDCNSLPDLEKQLRLRRGNYRSGRINGPLRIGGRKRSMGGGRTSSDRWGFPTGNQVRASARVNPETVLAASAGNLPLANKRIVLLGPLAGLTIEASIELVTELGGECQSQIDTHTNYVIACGTSLQLASKMVCEALADAADSDPEPTANGTRLLSERQFRALLPGGKAPTW